jgi:hypothetical protein
VPPARPAREDVEDAARRERSLRQCAGQVGTALVLIDVINDLEFPGSEQLLRYAAPWRGGSPPSKNGRGGHEFVLYEHKVEVIRETIARREGETPAEPVFSAS